MSDTHWSAVKLEAIDPTPTTSDLGERRSLLEEGLVALAGKPLQGGAVQFLDDVAEIFNSCSVG
jgi:hypothetical protein